MTLSPASRASQTPRGPECEATLGACPRMRTARRPGRSEERMATTYPATDITLREGLEAVRMRPGMYIGSTGPRGLHHLVYEVVDNAVDEALAGYCDRIEITILRDGGIRVADNGRGIPVDEHPVEHRPALE